MSAWSVAQMKELVRLRQGFLSGTAGARDYWRGPEDLDLYERTFAQRIGWKWDAVLGELEGRGWMPPSRKLVDWGCGTGIASRRVAAHWVGAFDTVAFSDRSAMARGFAMARMREEFAAMGVRQAEPEAVDCEDAVVLLSHVLSELSDASVKGVLTRLRKAAAVVWVESATHENARRLVSAVREPMVSAGWRAVAPCAHSGGCPLMRPENERHWCHHFARVPSFVHQDQAWRELSQKVGVDLSTLPYSFLVMERVPSASRGEGMTRVLGRSREFKGHLKVLACNAEGVADWTLQKRDAPHLYRELKKGDGLPFYRLRTEGGRIVDGDKQ